MADNNNGQQQQLDLKAQWDDNTCERHVKDLEPDAQYAMEDCKVPLQIQAKLSFAGFTTMVQIRGLGDTREEVKTLLSASLGIDSEALGGF